MNTNNFILADGRWSGQHGIGRFSHEILSRLQQTDILKQGPSPLSIKNLYWLPYQLSKYKKQYRVFFSPGFMPPLYSAIPFVFTMHDLIPLRESENKNHLKKIFYNTIIKSATHRAYKILTVSECSKNEILSWAKIPAEKIVVINNGISEIFSPEGKRHNPGYPYFLYVGNTKPHKNVPRLIQAFAQANIDSSIKLILTSQLTNELHLLIQKNHLQNRIVVNSNLSEATLAEYYRGAIGLLFPSLYEGFGLPVVEAMASGTPVITSNVTSLPEVAGNAAILINPLDIDELAFQIETIVTNDTLRNHLITEGFKQAATFSWDNSAQEIQSILNELNIAI
jgi:glycosyltransferase involved in cell wall biosynthesis